MDVRTLEGENMKKLRETLFEKNITQKELAEFAGCSEAYISRCIKGRDMMSNNVKEKIANYLGISVEEIFYKRS